MLFLSCKRVWGSGERSDPEIECPMQFISILLVKLEKFRTPVSHTFAAVHTKIRFGNNSRDTIHPSHEIRLALSSFWLFLQFARALAWGRCAFW